MREIKVVCSQFTSLVLPKIVDCLFDFDASRWRSTLIDLPVFQFTLVPSVMTLDVSEGAGACEPSSPVFPHISD